jgi:hypothetical protein
VFCLYSCRCEGSGYSSRRQWQLSAACEVTYSQRGTRPSLPHQQVTVHNTTRQLDNNIPKPSSHQYLFYFHACDHGSYRNIIMDLDNRDKPRSSLASI